MIISIQVSELVSFQFEINKQSLNRNILTDFMAYKRFV